MAVVTKRQWMAADEERRRLKAIGKNEPKRPVTRCPSGPDCTIRAVFGHPPGG